MGTPDYSQLVRSTSIWDLPLAFELGGSLVGLSLCPVEANAISGQIVSKLT